MNPTTTPMKTHFNRICAIYINYCKTMYKVIERLFLWLASLRYPRITYKPEMSLLQQVIDSDCHWQHCVVFPTECPECFALASRPAAEWPIFPSLVSSVNMSVNGWLFAERSEFHMLCIQRKSSYMRKVQRVLYYNNIHVVITVSYTHLTLPTIYSV